MNLIIKISKLQFISRDVLELCYRMDDIFDWRQKRRFLLFLDENS